MEFRADDYAIRCGYGIELAETLEKMLSLMPQRTGFAAFLGDGREDAVVERIARIRALCPVAN